MIAVIVINYHSEERTIAFVRNECSKIASDHMVVVVNNAATAESSGTLRKELPLCHVLDAVDNQGFARGNNMGADFVRKFRPDYILFANNDIVFQDDNVADALAHRLGELPDVGVIGPRVVGLDGRLQSPEPFMSFWNRHIWIYWCTPFTSERYRRKHFKEDYALRAREGYHYRVMGSFFMVRAKDFYDCGMMDPQTFLFAEEPILSERMKKIGRKVYYYPAVSVLHEHGATTEKYFDRVALRKIKFQSECHYYRTYIGTPQWQILLARMTYALKRLFGR